jgi:hypothetical protein
MRTARRYLNRARHDDRRHFLERVRLSAPAHLQVRKRKPPASKAGSCFGVRAGRRLQVCCSHPLLFGRLSSNRMANKRGFGARQIGV